MKLKTLITLILLIPLCINLESQTVEEVTEFYSKRDYENVVKTGRKVLENDSENPQLNMLVGRALADTKNHKEAIPYIIKGTADNNNVSWVRAWSFAYLGTCYYVTDNYTESKKNFYECIKLNATKNSTQFAKNYINSLQMSESFSSWETMEKENLRFHFQDKSNIVDIEHFMKIREDAYIEINKFFNATLFKKIDFYVWDNPEEAKEILGRELGFANSKLCIINSRNNQTRGHEITHILSDYGIHPVKKTQLINEGVAVYFDQTKRDKLTVARNALDNKEIDIIDLWNNPNNYPNNYNYDVGGALIEFLMNNGSDSQLKELLNNQTAETASNIYENFNDLILKFEKELMK